MDAEKYLGEKAEKERGAAVAAFLRRWEKKSLGIYGDQIPQALHGYCRLIHPSDRYGYSYSMGELDERGWKPHDWVINAPKLAPISLCLEVSHHECRISVVNVGSRRFEPEDDKRLWPAVIAYAAEMEELNQTRNQETDAWAAICWECRLDVGPDPEDESVSSNLSMAYGPMLRYG